MNPPYAFNGSRGGEAWRIWQWSIQEIAHRGWLRYGKQVIATRYDKQLVRHSWGVNPGLDKLEKETVVPKEAEISKEAGRST